MVLSGVHGFQYSEASLEKLWEPRMPELPGTVVVNCFQLFPRQIIENRDIEKWFMVDMTLRQMFDTYLPADPAKYTIGSKTAADAIKRERAGYQAAMGIVTHSHWSAESMIHDYGIGPEKIFVIQPGASLDPADYALWERESEALAKDPTDEMKLVFVGTDWYRKGLDRLLAAVKIGRHRGLTVTLRVIGCVASHLPAEFRTVSGVEWLGPISKRVQSRQFMQAVSECTIGCLLSRAEAGGIAAREFHALGLIVLGTDAGGAPEQLTPGASLVMPTTATPEQICDHLIKLQNDPSRRGCMLRIARQNRRLALWDQSVNQLERIWPYDRFSPLGAD
jgi:glycosyltransferase involved in cell wall biosynthesis